MYVCMYVCVCVCVCVCVRVCIYLVYLSSCDGYPGRDYQKSITGRVCISHIVYTLGKGMNPTIPFPVL